MNAASPPLDVEIAAGWNACLTSIVRPAGQETIRSLVSRGFQKPGDLEDRPGFNLQFKAPYDCGSLTRDPNQITLQGVNVMDLLLIAKTAADRVEAEATKARLPVAVSVIDIHGNIVLTHRMEGAPLFSTELSERKAYTSALVRLSTADLLPLVQPGQALYPLSMVSGGRYCAMGGGMPLLHGGEVVAGVGVSGGTVEEDVAIVEAALK